MSQCGKTLLAGAALALLLGSAGAASAQTFDPVIAKDAKVVELITTDDDGDVRETKLWIVLIEREAYLRTNASKWLANLRRDPSAGLRIDGTLYPVRAEVLSDPAWVARVDAATAQKYGWQEKSIHIFRISEPTIIRLHPPS